MRQRERRFLSCIYVLSLAGMVLLAARGLRQTALVSAKVERQRIVLLDAGHGGPDGGASAADGTEESGLNLAIARRTDAVLALMGARTRLVRDSEEDLSSPEAETIAQRKVSDIRNRVALINGEPDGLLVSIHQNSYPEDLSCRGAQVFYGRVGDSLALAERMQKDLQAFLGAERSAKAVPAEVYLMNHIDVPGVLVECGFLTNPAEAALLASADYQKKLAVVVAAAVADYLAEADSGV